MNKSTARGGLCCLSWTVRHQEQGVGSRRCQAEGLGWYVVGEIGSHRKALSRSESGQRLLSRVVLGKLR